MGKKNMGGTLFFVECSLAFLSGFAGTDNFAFQGKKQLSNTIRWKNYTGSLQWDHFYNENNYLSMALFASSYKMNFSPGINEYVFSIFSSIQDYGARAEGVLVQKQGINFLAASSGSIEVNQKQPLHYFHPGRFTPAGSSLPAPAKVQWLLLPFLILARAFAIAKKYE